MKCMEASLLATPLALLWLTGAGPAVADEAPVKTPIVIVEAAVQTELADLMSYPGRAVSRVKADIYAPTDGVVTKIYMPLGTSVRAGTKVLDVKNIDPVYEFVPVGVDTPVGGVVSAVDVTEGTKVTKGQLVATVTDLHQIEVVIEVPAADLGAFTKGLKGTFTLPMLGSAKPPFHTTVTGVSPLVDPVTGTATAELAIEAAKDASPIPPGAIGKVVFAINRRKGIQVPEQAIVYRGKDTQVRIVASGKAKLTTVVIGETRKGLTEILSGVQPGAVIVVRSSGFIADGQAVTVQASDVAKK